VFFASGIEPLVLGSEFAFELVNVVFAFPENVGHRRHVNVGWRASLRRKGTHRNEEMRLRRVRWFGVDADFGNLGMVQRLENDAFSVVLENSRT